MMCENDTHDMELRRFNLFKRWQIYIKKQKLLYLCDTN